jgi:hypothetical protein
MPILGCRNRLLMLAAGLLILTPVRAQAGWMLEPSLSLTEVYDDNLFSEASGRERDLITRLSPGLESGYESSPLTLLGRYSFDAENFAEHKELSDVQARREASIEFRYLPVGRFTLAFEGSYLETLTPTELHPEAALEAGRFQARRLSLHPSAIYRFTRFTTGRLAATLTREEAFGVRTYIRTATLGVDRRITSRNTGSLDYAFSRYDFWADETVRSQSLVLGWTHKIRPSSRFTLRAGPRVSEGSADLEASAGVHYKRPSVEASLTYDRTQTNVIGLKDTVVTDGIVLTGIYRPLRSLSLSLSPGFFRSTRDDFETKVYRANLSAAYSMTQELSLSGSYQYSLQQGSLYTSTGEEIRHGLFALKLEAIFR